VTNKDMAFVFVLGVGAVVVGNMVYRKYVAPHMHKLNLMPVAALPSPHSSIVSVQGKNADGSPLMQVEAMQKGPLN